MVPHPAMLRAMDGLIERLPPGGKSLVASTTRLGWRTVHGVILEGQIDDFFDYSALFPIVSFNLKGTTDLEWKRGTRYSRLHLRPGEFLLTPAGTGHSARSSGSNVAFSLFLDPAQLQLLAEQEWETDGSRVEIIEAYSRNAEFWALGQRLADQLQSPIPGSRLFAESLATQIAIAVLWDHSSLPRPQAKSSDRLTDHRLRKVIDYLHSSFGHEISLDALAKLAGLSPNYFLHAFKESTGRTPHRYLTELRIGKACEFLQNPNRSIVEISLAVGFSSQSHLTTVFRRFMKTTPAAYREQVLGLRSTSLETDDGDGAIASTPTHTPVAKRNNPKVRNVIS